MDILKEKLEKLGSLRLRAVEPGLERTYALLEKLGNPQHKLKNIIHVAGTNGKGSTIRFLKAILEAAGHSCNVYTSPDLIRFNERIVLSGKEISDTDLLKLIEEYHAKTSGIDATFFEATTAIAFMAFARNPADFTLLETGLGGRLDSTNVITNPILTTITPISFDHVDFLGDTLEKIASEKAGIIKLNAPCVISGQHPEAMKVILARCAKLGVKASAYGRDWNYNINDFPKPSLAGKHQYMNAACAATAAHTLHISPDAIATGIKSATWPARLQKLTGKIPEKLGFEVWLDGAHNEDGAKALAGFLSELPPKPTYIISGMINGKDAKAFYSHLKSVCVRILTIPIENESNAQNPEALAEICTSLGAPAESHQSLESALSALADTHEGNARLIICGSLYLAGVVLRKNE